MLILYLTDSGAEQPSPAFIFGGRVFPIRLSHMEGQYLSIVCWNCLLYLTETVYLKYRPLPVHQRSKFLLFFSEWYGHTKKILYSRCTIASRLERRQNSAPVCSLWQRTVPLTGRARANRRAKSAPERPTSPSSVILSHFATFFVSCERSLALDQSFRKLAQLVLEASSLQ